MIGTWQAAGESVTEISTGGIGDSEAGVTLHWYVKGADANDGCGYWSVLVAALTEREREFLAFEHLRWTTPGAKEEEIRRRFNVEPWRYFQQLNALIDRPEAQTADPTLIRILRERRG